jgi:hypothetical protein
MRIPRSPKALRRTRLISAIGALLLILMFVGTGEREYGVYFGDGWFVGVGNSCLQGGINRERFITYQLVPLVRGTYAMRANQPYWAMAWRPFWAADISTARGRWNWNTVVMPLWPLVILAVGIAAWSHGSLVMLRRLRARECLTCGYDLASIAGAITSTDAVVCPECGTKKSDAA